MPAVARALVLRDDRTPEMQLAADELARRGIGVERFLAKKLARRQVPLDRACPVIGGVDEVELALKQLGVEPPAESCYPDALAPWLLRRVWPSTLGEVEDAVRAGAEVFVKPRGRIKRFTGRVLDGPSLGFLAGVSRRQEVWCSAPVEWRAEHRAFVVDGEIRDVRPYAGDGTPPDRAIVDACVAAWTATGRAACGYAIDFGVLADGRTALVEVNDGYAIGAYGVAPGDYVDVLLARWDELTRG